MCPRGPPRRGASRLALYLPIWRNVEWGGKRSPLQYPSGAAQRCSPTAKREPGKTTELVAILAQLCSCANQWPCRNFPRRLVLQICYYAMPWPHEDLRDDEVHSRPLLNLRRYPSFPGIRDHSWFKRLWHRHAEMSGSSAVSEAAIDALHSCVFL